MLVSQNPTKKKGSAENSFQALEDEDGSITPTATSWRVGANSAESEAFDSLCMMFEDLSRETVKQVTRALAVWSASGDDCYGGRHIEMLPTTSR